MKHRCKITVLRKECFEDLQQQYLADPHSGPCPYFEVGQEFILEQERLFPVAAWQILRRSLGCHQPLCLCRPARRFHHGGLDQRRKNHDRLLQRRHPASGLQNRTSG